MSTYPHGVSTNGGDGARGGDALTLLVEGMSCDHCKVAITTEVGRVSGVESVDVDLESKVVRVEGTGLDPAAVVDAIDEAGYDAVPS